MISTLEHGFSITPEPGNTNAGAIDWTYSIPDKDLDFLGNGEKGQILVPVLIDDHHGGTITQNVMITVLGSGDLVAPPNRASIQQGGTLISSASVLANVTDADLHRSFSVSAVNGDPAYVGRAITGAYGTLILNSDGSYRYIETQPLGSAASRTSAFDSFSYSVSDGYGGTAESTLTISIYQHTSPVTAGSLSTDVAAAAAEIAANLKKGMPQTAAFHLNDGALAARLAADVAAQFGSQTNYTINAQGYINRADLPTNPRANESWDQCVGLVLGLDKNVPTFTGQWTKGSEQIDINGAPNPNIAEGTAVAIATFDSAGRYTGEHAAVFLGYGSEAGENGFFMLDQYVNQPTLSPASQPAEIRFHPFIGGASEYFSIIPS